MKWKDRSGCNRSILHLQKILSTISIPRAIGSISRSALQNSSQAIATIMNENRNLKMISDKTAKGQSQSRPTRWKNKLTRLNPCSFTRRRKIQRPDVCSHR
jgi:hypothetical protein